MEINEVWHPVVKSKLHDLNLAYWLNIRINKSRPQDEIIREDLIKLLQELIK